MSMVSSIASASMSMSQIQVGQAVSLAMINRVMDLQEQTGQALVEMMGAPPSFGRMDLRA